MMKFCQRNDILDKAQFGFRSKMSCVDAISTVTEYIRTAIEKKSVGQSSFIDLKKPFDTLDHEILITKMEKYGFRGKVKNILSSYLRNRSQFVYYNGPKTSKQQICTDVPQGSVLGPFLFLLYVNDLPNLIEDSQITMFADDTNLLRCGKKREVLLQEDIERVADWFISNKLTINVGKCEVISFGNGIPQEIQLWAKIYPLKSHPNT